MRTLFTSRILLPLLVSGALLSACSSPSTHVPMASEQEIRAEQARFEADVKNAPTLAKIEGATPVTAAMKQRLERVWKRVKPQALVLCGELYADVGGRDCEYDLVISDKEGINAFADGEKVYFTGAMLQVASDENHLAFVLAHELAHNMMDHPARVSRNTMGGSLLGTALDIGAAAAGVATGGAFGQLGGQATLLRYSPSFELEADYIGLYIVERAGYQIEKAPNFWRAMAKHHPQNIYNSTTHPTNPERFVVMNKTINEIRSKQKLGLSMLPEFKSDEHKKSGII